MRRSLIVLGLVAVVVVGAVAKPAVVEGAGAVRTLLSQRLLDTPMGRFLTGQVGQLLVLRSRLNVTPEQREQVVRVLQSHRAELAQAAKPVVAKRRALREATTAETLDEPQIRDAAADLGKALGDLAVIGARVKAEVRATLTAEQRKTLDEFRTQNYKIVDEFIDRMAKAN